MNSKRDSSLEDCILSHLCLKLPPTTHCSGPAPQWCGLTTWLCGGVLASPIQRHRGLRSLPSQTKREPGLPGPQGHLLGGRGPARQSTRLPHGGGRACPAKVPTSTPAWSMCCCGHLSGWGHPSQEGLCGREWSPSMSPPEGKWTWGGVRGRGSACSGLERSWGGWTRTFGGCCPGCRRPRPSLANE